ncbi:NUDIX domain-containing protein [Streptomyces luteolifulvus]|jgi:8-oxo-dGTP pyrophosphatase MutT (NUDIX family)|uniref:NUDIX domain-containing protein n=1 Tax=Streptomyces luteolifulvus TaxID=2615112 RepID=A0A6H9V6K4_9ACTN|nr:NUDIX domain-containing protein [Streptomyces luteolifulvus]KAB1148221.1 NUDIX domain-containing protein [Streptomyces luteolifulvus]
MATPDFIRTLRASVGHDLLWLPGVSAVVLDDEGRVLLNRRSDNGKWSLIGGIPEPGEQPAACAVREIHEETGVRAVVERLIVVQALHPVRYDNGDICQYMDISFRCRSVGGEARVNDDESLDVGWFAVDALPDLNEFALLRIKQALSDAPTWFDPATSN